MCSDSRIAFLLLKIVSLWISLFRKDRRERIHGCLFSQSLLTLTLTLTLWLSYMTWIPQKIYSLGSGSWNIQEEIRRVRSKATEDMLKTTPSMKIDLSSFSLEPKSIQKSLLADKTEVGRGEKVYDLNYVLARKSIDASAELAAGVSPCHGIPG